MVQSPRNSLTHIKIMLIDIDYLKGNDTTGIWYILHAILLLLPSPDAPSKHWAIRVQKSIGPASYAVHIFPSLIGCDSRGIKVKVLRNLTPSEAVYLGLSARTDVLSCQMMSLWISQYQCYHSLSFIAWRFNGSSLHVCKSNVMKSCHHVLIE